MFTYQSLEFLYRIIHFPAIAWVALLEAVGKRVLAIADREGDNLQTKSGGRIQFLLSFIHVMEKFVV